METMIFDIIFIVAFAIVMGYIIIKSEQKKIKKK
jgi:preprotein translocase subunit YajC